MILNALVLTKNAIQLISNLQYQPQSLYVGLHYIPSSCQQQIIFHFFISSGSKVGHFSWIGSNSYEFPPANSVFRVPTLLMGFYNNKKSP